MKKGFGYLLALLALTALLRCFAGEPLRSWLSFGRAEGLIRSVGSFIARQEALLVR